MTITTEGREREKGTSMIHYEDSLDIIYNSSSRLSGEKVAISDALGRVAADEVTSDIAVPSFDNSAMDGFAIRHSDSLSATESTPITLAVKGSTAAGDVVSATDIGGEVSATAWEIMTGAPIAGRYDAVVKIEDVVVNVDDGNNTKSITIKHPIPKGNNIRIAGEDFTAGTVLLKKGDIVTPSHIMALSAAGKREIYVSRVPKLAILSTGKEVIENEGESSLSAGQIYNSNSPYLMALSRMINVNADYEGIIHDEPDIFEKKVGQLLEAGNDIIISTGAVSMGKYDFIPDALRRLGADILFHKVNIRPGKPILYAKFPNGVHYFGLAGNPVSAAIGFRFFVVPLIRHMQNMDEEECLTARLSMPFPKKQGIRFFRKAYVSAAYGGRLQMELLKGQESFKVYPLIKANCWAVFGEDMTGSEVGEPIDIYPLVPDRWEIAPHLDYSHSD